LKNLTVPVAMMASFGKRLTRFCGRTNHSRGPNPDFACSWERPLFLARLFGKPDHALWPKLQGKLNRECLNIQRFGRFWQSAFVLAHAPANTLLVEFLPIGSRCRRYLSLTPFDRIRLAAHSAKVRGLSIDAAHDCALFAGAERTGAAGSCARTAGGPEAVDRRAVGDRGSDCPACQNPRPAGGAGAARHPARKRIQSPRRLSPQLRAYAGPAPHPAGAF